MTVVRYDHTPIYHCLSASESILEALCFHLLSLSLSLSRSTELLRRFHLDPIPSIAILLQCLFELSQGNKVLKLLFIFIPKLAEPLIDGFTLGMSHLKLTSYAVSSNGQNTRATVTSRDTNWLTKLISIKFYSTFQPTFLLES